MSRFVIRVLTIVCLLGIGTQYASAQGPIRKVTNELQLQKADYPGPIAYAPSDQDTRSKRLRLQTGHYGMFYNCDNEECKRNSPYICWNSQHKADWYCGWKAAWRKDKQDIIQRLFDGSCKSCDCQDCGDGQVHPAALPRYSQKAETKSVAPRRSLVAQVQKTKSTAGIQQQRRTIINAASLGRANADGDQAKTAPQREAKRKGMFRVR